MMTDHNKDMARMAETMHRAMCEIPQPDVDAAWRDMEKRMQRRGGIGLRKRWLGTAAALAVELPIFIWLLHLGHSKTSLNLQFGHTVSFGLTSVLHFGQFTFYSLKSAQNNFIIVTFLIILKFAI